MRLSFVLLAGAVVATAAVSMSARVVVAPGSPAARRDVSLERLPPASRAGQEVLWGQSNRLLATAGGSSFASIPHGC